MIWREHNDSNVTLRLGGSPKQLRIRAPAFNDPRKPLPKLGGALNIPCCADRSQTVILCGFSIDPERGIYPEMQITITPSESELKIADLLDFYILNASFFRCSYL